MGVTKKVQGGAKAEGTPTQQQGGQKKTKKVKFLDKRRSVAVRSEKEQIAEPKNQGQKRQKGHKITRGASQRGH